MIHGIDVSGYQSSNYDIRGQSFVFVKATEGSSYVNPKYHDQLAHGRSNGLVIGHYHFEHHGSVASQVEYFIEHADVKKGEIIALDWEQRGLNTADKDVWLKAIKKHYPNNKVILYTYTSMWKGVDSSNFVQDGLWIADPNHSAGKPAIEHPWLFHQYSSAGNIDRNVAKFDTVDKLRSWCSAPKPKPIYAPFPGDKYFRIGRTSKLVTELGKALVRAGWKGYKFGPGPIFTATDKKAVAWFQRKQGWSGADADGYPGPETWKRLKVNKPK